MAYGIRAAADALISVLFPAPCALCGETLTTAGRLPICESCFASLAPLSGAFCATCGRLFRSEAALDAKTPRCFACRQGLYAFDAARSYGAYTHHMVRAIGLLKYERMTQLGVWFAERLHSVVQQNAMLREVDVVVPVPLHRSRQRERGYNQAELIAKPLARKLKVALGSYLLVRTKPRPERLLLSRRERWLTVRGAYEMRKGAQIDNLRVLLIDDVFTTGATLDACAKALKKSGAKRVMGLTVARAMERGSGSVGKPGEKPQTPRM